MKWMMECGPYIIKFDRTGFPMVRREGWNFQISLFPVSKYQFERFMVDSGQTNALFTDRWYRNLLTVNPRAAWKNCDRYPWEHFITGLNSAEAALFLKYLGRGFRLPDVNEWNSLLESDGELIGLREELKKCCSAISARPVELWIDKGMFPLVKEGILEMVRGEDGIPCLGRPWQDLWPNTWNPGKVKKVNFSLCQKAIGFRTVKDIR